MLTVPPGAYPLRGFAYLCSHPKINVKVAGFLAGVSALCLAGILALLLLTFPAQLNFVGRSLLGTGLVGKLTTCFMILAEASVAVYLIFKQTMQVLQRKLFQKVLHSESCPCRSCLQRFMLRLSLPYTMSKGCHKFVCIMQKFAMY